MKAEAKIRMLVVDDHFVVRMGLIGVVNTEADMEVVGEAADGDQAVAMFDRLKPDLVLMDISMPVKDGVSATMQICTKHPGARILILSTYEGDNDIYRAIQAGAKGYILKNATSGELIPALRAVADGHMWIPREIAARLASRKMFEELTPREIQVLEQLAKGLANKEIGDTLSISLNTVKDHLKNILGKLHVADRTEAVTTALQRGIIRLP